MISSLGDSSKALVGELQFAIDFASFCNLRFAAASMALCRLVALLRRAMIAAFFGLGAGVSFVGAGGASVSFVGATGDSTPLAGFCGAVATTGRGANVARE